MKAHAFAAQGLDELAEQVRVCSQSFKPTLAIIFCSSEQHIPMLTQFFGEQDISLLGCTTAGEICNAQFYDQAIACLLLEIDPAHFELFLANDSTQSTYQLAYTTGQYAEICYEEPALLLLSGGVDVNAEKIIAGIRDGLDQTDTPVFGGLAGDNMHFKETLVFSSAGSSSNGLLTLILNREKIEMIGLATSGWEPIGLEHTITKATENIVYTINDVPALDFFIKYFGDFQGASAEDSLHNDFENVSAQYPLQIIREDGRHILRSPLYADTEKKALVLAGGVEEGDRFKFSMSPGFQVIENTVDAFVNWCQKDCDPDAAIFFSCIGRHAALGPMIGDEISGIYQQWEKPMIGFFSYGEIGATIDGPCDFHNETCSVVLLKERD